MKILVSAILITILASTSKWQEKKSIPGFFQSVEVDEQGAIYLVNDQKHLVKFDASFDSTYTFDVKSAEVDFVSPQNSLKVLTFNKGLNSVQFLDKTLSPSVDELNLDDAGFPLVEALGMSRDNNFWVFDQDQQALKKLDTKMNVIVNSGNLINITTKNWSPIRLKEFGERVYVNDTLNGLIEFDFFGSYIQTIQTKIKSNFYVMKDKLWFLRNDSLITHDLIFHNEQGIKLPQKNIKEFAYYRSQFYLLTQEKLYIYGLSKN